MPLDKLKETLNGYRATLKIGVAEATQLKEEVRVADAPEGQDKGEVIANLMLAIRHLEDAAMRFGKAIQAADGGISPLGGPNTPGK